MHVFVLIVLLRLASGPVIGYENFETMAACQAAVPAAYADAVKQGASEVGANCVEVVVAKVS